MHNAAGAKACSFKQCINQLLHKGVPWQDLIRWPKEQGCGNPYARKILSQALTEAGIRRRKPGAGRETPEARGVGVTSQPLTFPNELLNVEM